MRTGGVLAPASKSAGPEVAHVTSPESSKAPASTRGPGNAPQLVPLR